MPFEKLDPIAEAIELQEMFNDDPETKEMFRQYELEHREAAIVQQEELELRNRLVEMRKSKNITQRGTNSRNGNKSTLREFENPN